MSKTTLLLIFTIIANLSYSQNINEELSRVSASIISQLQSSEISRIAIIDFTNPSGDVSELGRSISNRLRIEVAKNPADLTIVNRSILNDVLKEERLFKDGIVDPNTVREINFIGVQALIIGEISDYGNNYSIEIQLIDTESSDIAGGEILEVPKTENLKRLNENILSTSQLPKKNDIDQGNNEVISKQSFYPYETVVGDLRVKIMDVYSSNSGLQIDFKIFNNLDIPSQIGIYVGDSGSNSTKINNDGDIYYSTQSKIAGNVADYGDNASELVSSKAWVNASVNFKNIPDLEKLDVLQIGYFYFDSRSGWQYYPEIYRDLPVSKK